MSLRAEQPLYLVGAFGGAAHVTVDGLEGRARAELTTDWYRREVPQYDAAQALLDQTGVGTVAPESIQRELAALGSSGPAAALNNGLDDGENREMFSSTDPTRLVELLLLGLSRWSEANRD